MIFFSIIQTFWYLSYLIEIKRFQNRKGREIHSQFSLEMNFGSSSWIETVETFLVQQIRLEDKKYKLET